MNTKLNRSDWIVILIVYVVTIVINSMDYYREGNMIKEYFIDFSSGIILSLVVVLFFMYWLIPNYLVKKKAYFLFAFLGLLSLFISGIIDYTAGFWSGENDWSKYPSGLRLFLICVFGLTDDIGILLGVLLTKKFYEGQTEFIKIEKQQKENELKLLRSQLDPHFLFNNLNTLDALIDSDTIKAKEYINRLSLIYRYLIQTKDTEVMELSEELTFAENYIFLIKTRFDKDYDFTLTKKASLENKFIPTGAILTLLENVVKHNKAKSGTIKTHILVLDERIEVINEKTNFSEKKESFGTGLHNLKTRYALLSDQEIFIINKPNEFKVVLPILNLSKEN